MCFTDDQIKENAVGEACGLCGGERGMRTEVLLGKPEVQRPLSKPKLISEDNIKKGSSSKSMWAWKWIDLPQVGTGGGFL